MSTDRWPTYIGEIYGKYSWTRALGNGLLFAYRAVQYSIVSVDIASYRDSTEPPSAFLSKSIFQQVFYVSENDVVSIRRRETRPPQGMYLSMIVVS